MSELLRWLADLIPWRNIGRFLKDIYDHQKIALASSLCVLVVAIGLLYWYWQRSARYDEIVRNTLWADMETTPQRFKGLEAFIYSNLKQSLPNSVDVHTELGQRALPDKFVEACKKLQDSLSAYQVEHKASNDSPKVRVARGNNDGTILTDDIKPGFLFLPVYAIRPPFTKQEAAVLANSKASPQQKAEIIDKKLVPDEYLKKDVLLTGAVATEVQAFTKVPVVGLNQNDPLLNFINNYPTQVYVITLHGINRIFSNEEPDPENYYGTQFSATTFFPSRPYFWPPFQTTRYSDSFMPTWQKTLGDYFYISRPYMDLAGNGIVITLSRGLVIDGVVQAVLCFDLPFVSSNSIDPSLRKNIALLEGESVQVTCETRQEGNVDCRQDTRAEKVPPTQAQDRLILETRNYIQTHNGAKERSEIAGSIQVINESANSDEMHFSVPIAEASHITDQQKTTLLVVSLNLMAYRRRTTLIAGGAAVAFSLVLLFLTYFWGTTIKGKKEYQVAFREVAKVMYRSPTPYVRLNADDRISDCSLSFCEKLGYPATRESVVLLKSKTFQELCAEESADKYEEVEEKRRKGEPVEPYPLEMKRADGSLVAVIVRSAAVPATERGKMPETFGILLDHVEKVTASG